jgi:hypothetical protein
VVTGGANSAGAAGVLNPAAAATYTPVAQTAAVNAAGAGTAANTAAAGGTSFLSNPLVQYGAIQAGTQIVGGYMAGKAQEEALAEQRKYETQQLQAAQDLRNANVGADLFAPTDYSEYAVAAPQPAPAPAGLARRYMPRVEPGSPGYVPGSQFAQAYNNLPPGSFLGQYVNQGVA